MQSPRWDQEAATSRADARKDYGGFPRRTKDVFKQKTQRFRSPNLTDSQMSVLSTTVVYFLTVCLYYFAFFRHAKVVLFFTAASSSSCPAFAMSNGKRRFEVSLAACCGVAVSLGAIAGLYSYANFGFFSWKLFTSRTYENVVPSEDPGMVADAARMSFAKEAYSDQARSVGFAAEDGNLYCAAPISSHSAPKEEVNFWAVGVNCCALRGRFECDAAPKQTGGSNELDVDEWEQYAVTEGPPQVIGWFFDWLRKQSAVARSKMLAFVTGSSVSPCGWQGLRDPQGRFLPFRVQVEGNATALPSAHTCTNLSVLPPVSERWELETRSAKVSEFAGREMLSA